MPIFFAHTILFKSTIVSPKQSNPDILYKKFEKGKNKILNNFYNPTKGKGGRNMSNIEYKQRLERDLAAFEKQMEKQRQMYVSKIAYLAEEEEQQFWFLDVLEFYPEQVDVSETNTEEDIVFSSTADEYKMHCFWIEKATNQTLWWPSFTTQRPYYVCSADVRARLEKIKEDWQSRTRLQNYN